MQQTKGRPSQKEWQTCSSISNTEIRLLLEKNTPSQAYFPLIILISFLWTESSVLTHLGCYGLFGRASLPDSLAPLLDSPKEWFLEGRWMGSWWEVFLCWFPPKYNESVKQCFFLPDPSVNGKVISPPIPTWISWHFFTLAELLRFSQGIGSWELYQRGP